ncbi:VCBS domain-containing protein [Bradyrhizobium sp. AZCC 1610]|uniref:VCBS domain-containing protein n=1 Tax=Bradyrhizobium sp. AZCC 1610 TaxID=3117020 RepID=UPI002FF14B4B
MNYAGKFGSGDLDPFSGADIGLGPLLSPHGHLSSPGKFHVDQVSTHAPTDAIIISDAHLLFHGNFKRSGVDLILADGDRELVLNDYFRGEKRAALASPDGAHLTGDIVNALAGHIQFAQADGSASVAPAVIGHVTKLAGNATAIRNGVSIILNQGDTVHKGDVVQSGSDSTLGITFIDGTVFGLASNAKMVLNEMVYDPNGSDNKSLLSLVQGTISFVAGATAKKGDMKVDTPVATMGIRGTAVLVEIDFEVPSQGGAPPAKFQVLVEPDGTTGSYILFDKTTLTPIATVNRAGTQTIINGQGTVSFQSSVQLSPDAQKIISDVFSLKFTDLNNPNTKLTNNSNGSIDPQTSFLKLASNDFVPVTLQFVNVPDKPAALPSRDPGPSAIHIAGPPKADANGGAVAERIDVTASPTLASISGTVSYADINPDDVPSVQAAFSSFVYANSQKVDVTATLTAAQLAAIKAVEVPLAVVQDPNGKNTGKATWTYSIADGAFDFLASGETLTLTYMARVDNNYAPSNETTFVPFSIVVTGTNDKPTLSATGGTITERIGTGNAAVDTVTGTVTFADVDLTDRPVVSAAISTTDPFRYYDAEGNDVTATLTPAQLAAILAVEVPLSVVQAAGNTHNGSATWTYSIEDSAFDFIAKGETLTLNYVAQVDDGHGGVISTPITVSIKGADVVVIGTNDVPSIDTTSDAFAELSNVNQPNPTGSTALDTASGTISFIDVDLTDRPVASAAFTAFTYLNPYDVDVTSQLTATQLAAIAAVDEPLAVVQAPGNTNNGSASWSYSVADGAFDFLADGEILTLTYTATVDDGHGGVVAKPITVTVTGSNDTAEITSDPQTAAITERADTHDSATPDTASGAITFSDADLTDTHDVKVASVNASGVMMTGLANGTVQLSWLSLGALTDSTDGVPGSKSWSFSAPDSYFDYLADGETVTLTYTVEVDDDHGGVTSQDVVVTIDGSNDAPLIAAIGQQGLSEQTDTAPLTTTISVTFTDLDLSDVGHSADITGAVASGTTTGLALDQAALIALVTPGAVTKNSGSSSGSVALSFSATSTAFDYLAKGEVLTLTYTVAIDDGDGGVTPQTFVVTVTGSDDAPVMADIAQKNLTEQADTAALTATIPVTFADVDLTDVGHSATVTLAVATGTTTGLALDEAALKALVTPGAVTKNSGSSSGSVELAFSAGSTVFDYLAKDEVLTLTYTVAIDDGDGGVTTQTFVVTITGTNDNPVVATADVTSAVTELVVPVGDLTDSGTIALADVDLTDTHNVGPTVTASAGALGALTALVTPDTVDGVGDTINWNYSVAASAVEYLAKGQTKVEQFTITLEDGNGGTVDRTIEVTITGTEDAPVIANIAQKNLTEQTNSSALTATIPVTFTDVDLADVGHSADITGVVVTGATTGLALGQAALMALVTPGGVTKNSGSSSGSVELSFAAASTAFDYLAVSETLTLTYTISIDDGDGGATSKTFAVTITGTNDAPVVTVSNPTLATVMEDDATNAGQTVASFVGTSIADVDKGAVQGIAITSTTGTNGHWEYSADGNTFFAFPAVSTTSALLLAATDVVKFVPDGTDGGAATLTYVAWDQTTGTSGTTADVSSSGGSTAFSSTSDTASLTVLGANHAPVVQSGVSAKQAQLANTNGIAVFDGQFFFGNVKLTVSDPDGDPPGIAITGVDNGSAGGSWQYEISAGEWIAIELAPGEALLLSAGDNVRFSGSGSGDTEHLTFVAWDGTDGSTSRSIIAMPSTTGGTTAFSSGVYSVGAKNDAPIINTIQFTVVEDQFNGTMNLSSFATSGNDVIFSTAHDDILKGGVGADQFVFAEHMGNDTIADFLPGQDKIDLLTNLPFTPDNAASFQSWLTSSAVAQTGVDTLIQFDGLLSNVAKANLHMSDFILHPGGSGNI